MSQRERERAMESEKVAKRERERCWELEESRRRGGWAESERRARTAGESSWRRRGDRQGPVERESRTLLARWRG